MRRRRPHRATLWMNNLERGGSRGFAEVPRLASLVLLKGVKEGGHVYIVVVVKVAPPLLVRTQKMLKLLQEKFWISSDIEDSRGKPVPFYSRG